RADPPAAGGNPAGFCAWSLVRIVYQFSPARLATPGLQRLLHQGFDLSRCQHALVEAHVRQCPLKIQLGLIRRRLGDDLFPANAEKRRGLYSFRSRYGRRLMSAIDVDLQAAQFGVSGQRDMMPLAVIDGLCTPRSHLFSCFLALAKGIVSRANAYPSRFIEETPMNVVARSDDVDSGDTYRRRRVTGPQLTRVDPERDRRRPAQPLI